MHMSLFAALAFSHGKGKVILSVEGNLCCRLEGVRFLDKTRLLQSLS